MMRIFGVFRRPMERMLGRMMGAESARADSGLTELWIMYNEI